MLWVVGLIVGLWLLGWIVGIAAAVRFWVSAAIWIAAGAAFLVLGPRLATLPGADVRTWVVVSLVAALFLAYRWGLRRLHGRALRPVPAVVPAAVVPAAPAPLAHPVAGSAAPATPATPATPARPGSRMSEDELDRYARHILLREIGGPGQKKLREASVLVVGAGGLGSPVLMYLAASGLGRLVVVDDDLIDVSNLQRQVIHTTERIGQPKVDSARAAITALNPHVAVETHQTRLTEANAGALIGAVDLVLDGTDNFDTRYLVNRVAARLGKPLIAAAITQWEGQISLYDPAGGTPCYECVFPTRPAPGMVPTCAEAGVAAPLPGILGSMMAMETVKHLTGAGETLRGKLLVLDALYNETRVFQIEKRADCPACGGGH